MNHKSRTFLFIGCIAYEIALKFAFFFTPSLSRLPGIQPITAILTILVGICIAMYAYMEHIKESDNKLLNAVLIILLVLVIINVSLRFPPVANAIGFSVARILSHSVRFGISLLILAFFILFYKSTDEKLTSLRFAAQATGILFGLKAILGIISIIQYRFFMDTGTSSHQSPIFLGIMTLLYGFTRVAMINFVWQYYICRFSKL